MRCHDTTVGYPIRPFLTRNRAAVGASAVNDVMAACPPPELRVEVRLGRRNRASGDGKYCIDGSR